jgi:hypothetical protein
MMIQKFLFYKIWIGELRFSEPAEGENAGYQYYDAHGGDYREVEEHRWTRRRRASQVDGRQGIRDVVAWDEPAD